DQAVDCRVTCWFGGPPHRWRSCMNDRFADLTHRLGCYSVASEATVPEDAVTQFEQEVSLRLPDDYKAFLEHHGMSVAPGLIFPDPNQPAEPGGGVGVFFGLQATGDYHLLDEWEDMQSRIPDCWLPIAASPGGSICLAISGDARGSVWWVSETAKGEDKK